MLVIGLLLTFTGLFLIGSAMLVFGKGRDPEVKRYPDDIPSVKVFGVSLMIVAALFAVLLVGTQSLKVVGANEVAVPVTLGHVDQSMGSGVHVVAPWTDVTKYPTRPKTVTTVANFRTNESGKGAIRISGRWAVDKDRAADLFKQRRNDDAGEIEKQLVEPNVQAAVGAYFGTLTNLNAVNGSQWETNANGVEAKLVTYLAKYGIVVDSLQIREVNPDSATDAAIARVAAQQRETAVANESNNTAIAQATQQKTAATGLKDAAAQVSSLTDNEYKILCLQAAERIMNKNNEKGIPTYTLPCQTGGGSVLAK
jgi:regulator of protease activity HflC (stomatin/prohibitin superfamily)